MSESWIYPFFALSTLVTGIRLLDAMQMEVGFVIAMIFLLSTIVLGRVDGSDPYGR